MRNPLRGKASSQNTNDRFGLSLAELVSGPNLSAHSLFNYLEEEFLRLPFQAEVEKSQLEQQFFYIYIASLFHSNKVIDNFKEPK